MLFRKEVTSFPGKGGLVFEWASSSQSLSFGSTLSAFGGILWRCLGGVACRRRGLTGNGFEVSKHVLLIPSWLCVLCLGFKM